MSTIAILCVTQFIGTVDCIEYPTLDDCQIAESLIYRPTYSGSLCDNFTIDRLPAAPLSSPLPVVRP